MNYQKKYLKYKKKYVHLKTLLKGGTAIMFEDKLPAEKESDISKSWQQVLDNSTIVTIKDSLDQQLSKEMFIYEQYKKTLKMILPNIFFEKTPINPTNLVIKDRLKEVFEQLAIINGEIDLSVIREGENPQSQDLNSQDNQMLFKKAIKTFDELANYNKLDISLDLAQDQIDLLINYYYQRWVEPDEYLEDIRTLSEDELAEQTAMLQKKLAKIEIAKKRLARKQNSETKGDKKIHNMIKDYKKKLEELATISDDKKATLEGKIDKAKINIDRILDELAKIDLEKSLYFKEKYDIN